MSKRIFPALIALIAAGANAQTMDFEPKIAIEPQAGMSKLLGDGSEYAESGFSIGLTALSSPMQQVQFGISANYNHFTINIEDMLADNGLRLPSGMSVDETFTIFELTPVVRFSLVPPDQKFIPFLQGGLGMYFTKAEAEASYQGQTKTNSESDQYFGINISGGFQIKLNDRARLQIAPSYHIVFSGNDSEDSEASSDEETSKYFAVRAGLSFGL